MQEEMMENLAGVWYLATTEGDQPHVRPVDNVATLDGKIYFGTTKNKKMFQQMVENPKIEGFVMTDFGPYRFMAEAYPTKMEEITKEAFSKMGKPYEEGKSVAVELTKIVKN